MCFLFVIRHNIPLGYIYIHGKLTIIRGIKQDANLILSTELMKEKSTFDAVREFSYLKRPLVRYAKSVSNVLISTRFSKRLSISRVNSSNYEAAFDSIHFEISSISTDSVSGCQNHM